VKGSYACINNLCFLVFFIHFLLFFTHAVPVLYFSLRPFSCAASCLYYDCDASSGVLVGYYCTHTLQAYLFLTYLLFLSATHPSSPHARFARMKWILPSTASLLTTTHPRPFLACHRLPALDSFSIVHHRTIIGLQ